MRDYYAGMAGKVLSEIGASGTYLRLPLYNLTPPGSEANKDKESK